MEAIDPKAPTRALEAYFFRQMLSSVPLVGSSASGFEDMIREVLAEKLAEAEPLGLRALVPEAAALPSPTVGTTGPSQRRVERYQATATLTRLPVPGVLSSGFGTRTDPMGGGARHHAGTDIAAALGTPVVCAGSGRVVRAEEAGSYGLLVVVDHGGGLETRYAHLASIDVRVGQRLDAGVPLGTVGSSGRSTGPHLHFEVRRDGRAVNAAAELSPLKSDLQRPNPLSESP